MVLVDIVARWWSCGIHQVVDLIGNYVIRICTKKRKTTGSQVM